MRRLVVVAVLAAAAFFALALFDEESNEYTDGEAGWSVVYPDGWHVERSSAAGHSTRTGVTFANFAMRRAAFGRRTDRGTPFGVRAPSDGAGRFPGHGVALRVFHLVGGPYREPRRFGGVAPLRPSRYRAPGAPRPLEALVGWDETGLYAVQVWIGDAVDGGEIERLSDALATLRFSHFPGRRVEMGLSR